MVSSGTWGFNDNLQDCEGVAGAVIRNSCHQEGPDCSTHQRRCHDSAVALSGMWAGEPVLSSNVEREPERLRNFFRPTVSDLGSRILGLGSRSLGQRTGMLGNFSTAVVYK